MKPRPITIRGTTYLSITAAARDLGVTTSTVAKAYTFGNEDRIGMGSRACCIPVTIRGVEYPSYKAAAEALGVSKSNVHKYAHRGTLDSIGLGRNHNRRVRTAVDGVWFDTRREAAKAAGAEEATLRAAMVKACARGLASAKVKGRLIEWESKEQK